MKKNRRDFIKILGISSLPVLIPNAVNASSKINPSLKNVEGVNFVYDGLAFSPAQYIDKLSEIQKKNSIKRDVYGSGGDTQILENKFAKLTGKEKAIYLPTGTLANQLAIKLLSGHNTKVIVPENSHVFRDEADAAQSVHQKRLIPVGKNKDYFNVTALDQTIKYLKREEVFRSGFGAVVIENPIRRANGTIVPLEEVKKIAAYCQSNGLKMHLDGARIHLASAFANQNIKEYSSYFDTVYISLYKYLNTMGGAILCGDAEVIEQIPHLIKIYGGTTYQTWSNSSVALHYLDGLDARLKEVVKRANSLIEGLNQLKEVTIKKFTNGSNIYHLQLSAAIDAEKLRSNLNDQYQISLRRANQENVIVLAFNESILRMDSNTLFKVWEKAMVASRV